MKKGMVTAISLLKSSEYRLKIIKAIGKDTVTPSEIAEKIGIRLNHVSMFLKELKENNLVKCLNEDTRKGRLYELTGLGKMQSTSLQVGNRIKFKDESWDFRNDFTKYSNHGFHTYPAMMIPQVARRLINSGLSLPT